jgi:hypothetical protein
MALRGMDVRGGCPQGAGFWAEILMGFAKKKLGGRWCNWQRRCVMRVHGEIRCVRWRKIEVVMSGQENAGRAN